MWKRIWWRCKLIDGEDAILMPGMINCHTHASMIPFRSLADDYKDRLKILISSRTKVSG